MVTGVRALSYFCILQVLWSGCGPAIPIQEKKVKKGEQIVSENPIDPLLPRATGLSLSVLSEPKLRTLSSWDHRRNSGVVILDEHIEDFQPQYTHHQIVFSRIFSGQGARTYYLAWPEIIYEAVILSVTMTHQSLSGSNLWSMESRFGSAFHELDRHRWIFPVAAFFEQRAEALENHILESETQLVKLEMSLSSNELIHFRVFFRISNRAL